MWHAGGGGCVVGGTWWWGLGGMPGSVAGGLVAVDAKASEAVLAVVLGENVRLGENSARLVGATPGWWGSTGSCWRGRNGRRWSWSGCVLIWRCCSGCSSVGPWNVHARGCPGVGLPMASVRTGRLVPGAATGVTGGVASGGGSRKPKRGPGGTVRAVGLLGSVAVRGVLGLLGRWVLLPAVRATVHVSG